MSSELLVNGIYPLDYFTLPGVDSIEYPDQFWWSSRQRFASILLGTEEYLPETEGGILTSEILEIDLGRIREVNYINMDILRAPIDVFIEYDIISSPDREASWVGVEPHREMPFDERVVYDADNRNGWFNADFFFTDPKGDVLHTRYLRITFRRRDEAWPVATSSPFKWPIFVKHLRLGRYISGYRETVGPLLTQDTPDDLDELVLAPHDSTSSVEVRQQFIVPASSVRGDVVPNFLGFGVLVKKEGIDAEEEGAEGAAPPPDVDLAWSLYDVTLAADPILLRTGTTQGTIAEGVSWLDWYLGDKQVLVGDTTRVYELRVSSRNLESFDTVFTAPLHQTQHLSKVALPGVLDFTLNSASVPTSEDLTPYLRVGDWFESEGAPEISLRVVAITSTTITAHIPWPSPTAADQTCNRIFPMTAWDENAAGSTFPTTSLLDNFNRSNGAVGASWGGSGLEIDTNQLKATTGAGGHIWWNTPMSGPDVETYIDFNTLPLATGFFILSARDAMNGTFYGLEGYRPGAGIFQLTLTRRELWASTAIAPTDSVTLAPGDAIGIRCVGTTIQAWVRISGVWTLLRSVADTAISGTAPNHFMAFLYDDDNSLVARFDNFSGGVATTGGYVEAGSPNLVMRAWADIADEGRDILGNSYRYAVQRERALFAMDHTKAGWQCEPVPSADGVEALYFDVRDTDPETNERIYRLIDAIRVAPRTPGVRMNVYYSRDALRGMAPENVNEWDNLLWTPAAQNSFTLRRNHIIDFPTPVRASYVKLEFTYLNPLPWRVPNYPTLPPKRFRRFPTWIEEQFTNSALRNVIEDWFLRSATPIQLQILENFKHPVREFEFKTREFLAALGLGKIRSTQIINNSLVNLDERSVIDPTTGSKIYIYEVDQFRNSLLISVDQDSVLGRAVVNRFDSRVVKDPLEGAPLPSAQGPIPTVSSINRRVTEAYSHLASTPMRFNRTARHVYREDVAEFNKKAYFVGIDEVQFLKANYEAKHDDEIITLSLYDDEFLDINTWSHETTTAIPDGDTVYVSYEIGEDGYDNPGFGQTDGDFVSQQVYTDEEVTLSSFLPIELAGKASMRRPNQWFFNAKVYSLPDKQGIQYFNGDDWQLSMGIDNFGKRTYSIARSNLTERLTVGEQPIYFLDASIVIGTGSVPDAPSYDAGIVIGVAAPFSSYETVDGFTYGEGEYGADTGTYERLPDIT